jgi:hypothetical protein
MDREGVSVVVGVPVALLPTVEVPVGVCVLEGVLVGVIVLVCEVV